MTESNYNIITLGFDDSSLLTINNISIPRVLKEDIEEVMKYNNPFLFYDNNTIKIYIPKDSK